jgi:nucleotide-binding universal stress UspA family protein
MKLEKILVGLDDSPRSSDVLAAAKQLAQQSGARLVLVHAVGLPSGIPPEYYVYPPTQLPEVLERDARRVLEKYARELPAEMIAALRPRVGTSWNAICELARYEAVDLIVIGSHGYGGIDRVLGTTAARVVNHADCSVLVVRPQVMRGS